MRDNEMDLVWKALSDPTRRRVLDLLREKPRTTGELSEAFPELSRFGVMKHLGILEEAGLVLVRREGRFTWHHLNAVPIQQIHQRWVSAYASDLASSLLQLKRTVENGRMPMESIQIEQEIVIEAEPHVVFDALTTNVGAWWSHSFSKSPASIKMEPWVGGRFYEEFAGGEGGALYATVQYIKRGETLRISGPMGMQGPVMGVIAVELESKGGATVVKLSHKVIGAVTEETRTSYTNGWRHLLGVMLKNFVENGVRKA